MDNSYVLAVLPARSVIYIGIHFNISGYFWLTTMCSDTISRNLSFTFCCVDRYSRNLCCNLTYTECKEVSPVSLKMLHLCVVYMGDHVYIAHIEVLYGILSALYVHSLYIEGWHYSIYSVPPRYN